MKLSYPTVSSWTISHQDRRENGSDKLQNISLHPQHKMDEAQLQNTGKKHLHQSIGCPKKMMLRLLETFKSEEIGLNTCNSFQMKILTLYFWGPPEG